MRSLLATGLLACLAGCGADEAAGPPPADLVLVNGNVRTVDDRQPLAQAVAIRGDRIVTVGSNDDVAALTGEATEVVDLAGRTAIPGFIEGHGHYMSFGESLMTLELRHAESFAEIVGMAADAATEVPTGEWIVGRGWHQDKWRVEPEPSFEGLPVHDTLSAATPDHPVMLGVRQREGDDARRDGRDHGSPGRRRDRS